MRTNKIVKSLFFIVFTMALLLTGCGSKEEIIANKINVVENSVPVLEKVDYYKNNNISMIQFEVTYSDDSKEVVSLDASMLDAESLNAFTKAGDHVINVTYKNVKTSFMIKIAANDVLYHTVTFHYWDETVETLQVEDGKVAKKPIYQPASNEEVCGWFTDSEFATEYDFNLPVSKNVDLYQKVEFTYTVNYIVECNIVDSVKVIAGKAVEIKGAHELQYATFLGWTLDGNKVEELTMPHNDVNLYASYEYTKYSVTFDFDNGTEKNVNYYVKGEAISVPENPTRPGYRFVGWDIEVPAQMAQSNIVVKAVWAETTYTLNYIVELYRGETLVSQNLYNTLTVKYNDLVKLPELKTFVGYEFSKHLVNDVEVSEDFNVPAEDVINLVTVYNAIGYTLTIDFDGVKTEDVVLYGTNINAILSEINTFKYGHTFGGWFIDKQTVPTGYTMPAQKITITGKNNPNVHILSLTVDNEVYYTDYEYYGTPLKDYIPFKEGYTFTKWVDVRGNHIETMPDNDIKLYPVWDKSVYTITINNNGVVTTKDYPYNELVEIPEHTEIVGYTFVGWRVNGQIIDHTNYLTPAFNAVIEAHYEINSYNLTYIVDGVSTTLSQKVVYNTPYLQHLSAPQVVEGRTFIGWYNVENDMLVSTNSLMPACDVTVIAMFETNEHQLTLVVEGREYTSVVPYGFDLSNFVFTKVGHEFAGWYTADGVFYETMKDHSVTLYARFNILSYKLSINNAGFVSVENVEYNAVITLPDAERVEGYTFIGWSVDGIIINPSGYRMPDHDLTITARYAINNYVAKFITNTDQVIQDQEITYGGSIQKPQELTKEGHTFINWTLNGVEVDFDTFVVPECDGLVFVANWQVNQYELRFVFGNGEEDLVIKDDFGKAYDLPQDPILFGHQFMGWDREVPSHIPSVDTVITAVWTPVKYTLTLVLNNGEVDVVKQYDYNTNIDPVEDPVRVGYTFKGWDKEVPTIMGTENIVLTANWEINQYNVSFSIDGTVDSAYNQTLDYNTSLTTYPTENPVKTGHVFLGWSASSVLYDSETLAEFKVPANDVEFVAVFEKVVYELTVKSMIKYYDAAEYVDFEERTFEVKFDDNIDSLLDEVGLVGYTTPVYAVNGQPIDIATYHMPASNVEIVAVMDEFDYSYLEYEVVSGYIVVTGVKPTFTGSTIYIPSYIDGVEVQYIDSMAFSQNKSISVVLIGYNVIHIGVNAFKGSIIEHVNIDYRSKLQVISQYAFANCEELVSINLPKSLETLGSSSFNGCSKLTSITLYEGVIAVGDRCFKGCENLVVTNKAIVTAEWATNWLGDASLA